MPVASAPAHEHVPLAAHRRTALPPTGRINAAVPGNRSAASERAPDPRSLGARRAVRPQTRVAPLERFRRRGVGTAAFTPMLRDRSPAHAAILRRA